MARETKDEGLCDNYPGLGMCHGRGPRVGWMRSVHAQLELANAYMQRDARRSLCCRVWSFKVRGLTSIARFVPAFFLLACLDIKGHKMPV
ncbi:hypothetical protein VFPBJ_07299 [Purpureocillium lilacinum]|uniref:Uncharacterized protein n=1 Tax=Purpureocillium lilacinum TaxID=33203 RepID=A0A179GNW4_PURLI|nr:hypothetical protein VFPBJ_07299 [Purpureocillium lilacinum]